LLPALIGLGGCHGVGEVVPPVFDVFASHAQAQEPRRQVFLAGHLGSALDRGFDAAETGG
jgi:hypothetical protein